MLSTIKGPRRKQCFGNVFLRYVVLAMPLPRQNQIKRYFLTPTTGVEDPDINMIEIICGMPYVSAE